MFERFATQARDAVHGAVAEAARRGDRRVASDHMLVAVLEDPAIAREVGVDAVAARAAVDRLDRRALEAVGVNMSAYGPLGSGASAKHLPLTPGAKAVLKRTLVHARAGRAGRIETAHLWQALRECRSPDPAAALLDELRRS